MRALPVNGKAAYGFKFRYTEEGRDRAMTALEPDPLIYPIACQIWVMAKEGYSSGPGTGAVAKTNGLLVSLLAAVRVSPGV